MMNDGKNFLYKNTWKVEDSSLFVCYCFGRCGPLAFDSAKYLALSFGSKIL